MYIEANLVTTVLGKALLGKKKLGLLNFDFSVLYHMPLPETEFDGPFLFYRTGMNWNRIRTDH